MTKELKNKLIGAALLFVVFVIFTICAKTVDTASFLVGSEETTIGFSAINIGIHEALGYNKVFYLFSKLLGVLAILVICFFAFLGVVQLIKGKSFKKVDADIYALAVFYVLVGIAYVLFEVLIVNYRPVDLGEGIEASYPSSHTMLAVCVFCTAAFQLGIRIKKQNLKKILVIACYVLAGLMVIFRMLSGVHWFTDIVGGILLSAFLISIYLSIIEWINNRKK